MTKVVQSEQVGDLPVSRDIVVAIDGPAGAGKSTVAKALAHALKLKYLDTGAMFRAVTSLALSSGIDIHDEFEIGDIADTMNLEMENGSVIANGTDVTIDIRSTAVTSAVSTVAANSRVRAIMRDRQRSWSDLNSGGVIEGRDIGTVVFPDAVLKVYLTASPRVRAERRVAEAGGDIDEIERAIAERDLKDSTRADSPLQESADSVVVDTSNRSIEEIVNSIVQLIKERLK
jgi:cytidylate kinase